VQNEEKRAAKVSSMSDSADQQLLRARQRVGKVLRNKWRLDRLLGVGGMAAVYAATHRNNGRQAAVKMLHPEQALNPDLKTRFLREGYVANQVRHPGAVAVLDDDEEDGAPFLVMELLEGETLEHRWERKGRRLESFEVLSIADKLLDVLAAAHDKGIVHRDIKPENIFITRDATIKVLDFGIARLLELSTYASKVTRAGSAMGTPAFMPPEQAAGDWDAIDARTDIWALGAVMFTMMSGRFVHEGRNLNEQLVHSATKPPSSLRTVAPGAPDVVVALVDRALAFERQKRWPDARAMQVALREAYHSLKRGAAAPSSAKSRPVDRELSVVTRVAEPAASDSGENVVFVRAEGRGVRSPRSFAETAPLDVANLARLKPAYGAVRPDAAVGRAIAVAKPTPTEAVEPDKTECLARESLLAIQAVAAALPDAAPNAKDANVPLAAGERGAEPVDEEPTTFGPSPPIDRDVDSATAVAARPSELPPPVVSRAAIDEPSDTELLDAETASIALEAAKSPRGISLDDLLEPEPVSTDEPEDRAVFRFGEEERERLRRASAVDTSSLGGVSSTWARVGAIARRPGVKAAMGASVALAIGVTVLVASLASHRATVDGGAGAGATAAARPSSVEAEGPLDEHAKSAAAQPSVVAPAALPRMEDAGARVGRGSVQR
jgi:serine/threonine-protein kinase